jgi:hypothetical protein
MKKTPRTFKRLSYIALAVVKTGPETPPAEAYVVNLSYGGVAVYTKADLAGQVEITLLHEKGPGRTAAETLWGHVAWNRKLGSMNACGIEFGNLNPEDHGVTMSLMEKYLKPGS